LDLSAAALLFSATTEVRDQFWINRQGPSHRRAQNASGNARVRRGLIQLAWRFLRFQKESLLGQWYRARTEGAAGKRKTTMIVALARKLLIALWRMVTTGKIPAGVALRTTAA
jgi:hypothetical protein